MKNAQGTTTRIFSKGDFFFGLCLVLMILTGTTSPPLTFLFMALAFITLFLSPMDKP